MNPALDRDALRDRFEEMRLATARLLRNRPVRLPTADTSDPDSSEAGSPLDWTLPLD